MAPRDALVGLNASVQFMTPSLISTESVRSAPRKSIRNVSPAPFQVPVLVTCTPGMLSTWNGVAVTPEQVTTELAGGLLGKSQAACAFDPSMIMIAAAQAIRIHQALLRRTNRELFIAFPFFFATSFQHEGSMTTRSSEDRVRRGRAARATRRSLAFFRFCATLYRIACSKSEDGRKIFLEFSRPGFDCQPPSPLTPPSTTRPASRPLGRTRDAHWAETASSGLSVALPDEGQSS